MCVGGCTCCIAQRGGGATTKAGPTAEATGVESTMSAGAEGKVVVATVRSRGEGGGGDGEGLSSLCAPWL